MDDAGRTLLSLLDGLPLALARAAAYIRETGQDIASYVRLYKEQWDDLMKSEERGLPLADYDRSVGATWTISLKTVESRDKSAANLVRLWAFLDNRDLWHGLLQVAADETWSPAWLYEIARSEVRFLEAVRLLLRYSMIGVHESTHGSYMMHPVLHRWTAHIQDGHGRRDFLQLATIVVGFTAPNDATRGYWILQRRLLPHVERCSWWIEETGEWFLSFIGMKALDAMHGLGDLYSVQGRHADAEAMYDRALRGSEKALGPDHPSTLKTIHNVGAVYHEQGQLVKAETMYERALRGKEKALGPDHPSTLDTIGNLGTVYFLRDQLSDAKAMYERALRGKEKALGPDHPSTLDTIDHLGTVYFEQGQLVEAETMYERALRGKERALGPDHPSTLDTIDNFGFIYYNRGQLDKAEAMSEQALRGKEKALGPDHLSTLNTVTNLATIYIRQGRFVETEAMLERALRGREHALGPNNLFTLEAVNNLAVLYHNQGQLVKAEANFERLLQDSQRTLGPSHPFRERVQNNIEALKRTQGMMPYLFLSPTYTL